MAAKKCVVCEDEIVGNEFSGQTCSKECARVVYGAEAFGEVLQALDLIREAVESVAGNIFLLKPKGQ